MTISEELKMIEDRDGILMPAAVVEYAEDPKTALHSRFQWDDAIAGEQFRLWQARKIISAQVTVQFGEKDSVRAYVSLKDDRQETTGYRNIVAVLSNEEYRAQMLEEALEYALIFKQRFGKLKELEKVFLELEKVRLKAGGRKRLKLITA